MNKIQDKEVREIVKAWYKFNGVGKPNIQCVSGGGWTGLEINYHNKIWRLSLDVPSPSLEFGKFYTIAELCGEEK